MATFFLGKENRADLEQDGEVVMPRGINNLIKDISHRTEILPTYLYTAQKKIK